jgi:hypothetical protein
VERSAHVVQLSGDPLAHAAPRAELAARYLLWDAFVAGRRRVDVHPLVLPRELHLAAAATAENAVRILGRVAEQDDGKSFGPEVHQLISASRAANDLSMLTRVDLLLGFDGRWRVCEVNADCPGGHNETLALPSLARGAGWRECWNPTRVVPDTVRALGAMAKDGAVALMLLTGYSEDLQVCAVLARALKDAGIKAVRCSPAALRRRDGALWAGSTRVTALYRFFPTEYMEGLPNLSQIAESVAQGEVRTLSSFAAMPLQTKAVMADAWNARLMLGDEHEWVVKHVPYTAHLDAVPTGTLEHEKERWVLKRGLGRVGDQVVVGPLCSDEEWRFCLDAARAEHAQGLSWIAQRFADQQAIDTPWGPRLVTLGAYVLDGRFEGYFARLTPQSHVSHDALVLPVFVEGAA